VNVAAKYRGPPVAPELQMMDTRSSVGAEISERPGRGAAVENSVELIHCFEAAQECGSDNPVGSRFEASNVKSCTGRPPENRENALNLRFRSPIPVRVSVA